MVRFGLFFGMFFLCGISAMAQDSLNVTTVSRTDYRRGLMALAERDNLVYAGVGVIPSNLDDDSSGFWILDVSNPAQPVPRGELAFPAVWSPIQSLALVGDYAFLALTNHDMEIVDISNPDAPAMAGSFAWSGVAPINLAVQDTLLCLTQWSQARPLMVMNIADPMHPEDLGSCFIVGANAVAMSGQYAYVTGTAGTSVVDLSNPRQPQVVGVVPSISGSSITIAGQYAYVPDGGLHILDISDPLHPTEVGSAPSPNFGFQIMVAGNYAFVAADNEGFRVLDISSPSSPFECGYYVPYAAMTPGVAVSGHYAFVSNVASLYVLDCSAALDAPATVGIAPQQYILHPAYPNPFNPSTSISFSLPRAGEVELKVFDVTGRRVQTLADQRLEAGEHRMSFDGAALPSGIYFARVEAGSFSQTQKLMLVK
jgi:hypothetical protein